jgi:hypothetical protein
VYEKQEVALLNVSHYTRCNNTSTVPSGCSVHIRCLISINSLLLIDYLHDDQTLIECI